MRKELKKIHKLLNIIEKDLKKEPRRTGITNFEKFCNTIENSKKKRA